MEVIVYNTAAGDLWQLTNDTPFGSRPIVLRCYGRRVVGDFLPEELVPVDPQPVLAAVLVAQWAGQHGRTVEENEAAYHYLSQWSANPPVEPGLDPAKMCMSV